MNLLLETAIKISIVVAVGLLAVSLFRRRSAALRHWMLAASMAAALATPLLMGLAPSWSLPVTRQAATSNRAPRPDAVSRREPRIGITMSVAVESTDAASPSPRLDPNSLLLAVWIVGLVINLAGLLVGFWRLRRIAARATVVSDGPWADAARLLTEHLGVRTPVTLLQSDRPALLVTWGIFAPKVILPFDAASWGADRIRVVLAHELAHVQRCDWIVQIASELLRIANWFNPLVWVASSRLRLESERACDDAVVNLGVSGRDYAQHLLELARQFGRAGHVAYPAVAIVPRPSNLERRVRAMLNTRLSRSPMTVFARFTTMAALLAAAIPIALFAQNMFATISGSITDPSGGYLPGVTVIATDTKRGARHSVRTDGAGNFELVGMPQGDYMLEATLPGFRNVRQALTLAGEDVVRNITMRIGSLEEMIIVTSSPREREPGPSPEPPRGAPKPPTCGPRTAPAPNTLPGGARRIGGQIRVPTKTKHVAPIYPSGSAAGMVLMEAVIGPDGHVTEVKTTNAAAPALALAAENAVRQWEFTPTLLNCVAVPVVMTITVDFR